MSSRPVLKEHDMDVVGSCFGIRFIDGGLPNGLFELYIEDDENWHFKCSANNFWLNDLRQVVEKAMESK